MSHWEPEEERFINQCRLSPNMKVVADVKHRCQEELTHKLASFVGQINTALTQRQIEAVTKLTVDKFNEELRMRGVEYEIKVSW